jgi:long-chain acyl-CoA synthetase
MARQTVLDAFLHHVKTRGDETAALVKSHGSFTPVSWRAMQTKAEAISAALIHHGIAPGDRVAIMMNTSLNWTEVDLGILGAGAISVPIYTSNLADECQYIIEDSGARIVFVDDPLWAKKFYLNGKTPIGLRKIVQCKGILADGLGASQHNNEDDAPATYLTLDTFLAHITPDPKVLAERRNAIQKDSPYSIIYTSGTTGRPKGVIVSHDNMLYEMEAIAQIELLRPDDVELMFLPLAHVFARVLQVAWLGIGHVMAFAESMDTIREDVGLSRPHLMAGVPRVYEKFYTAVVKKVHAQGGLVAKLFDRAMVLSERQEQPQPAWSKIAHGIERTLYHKLIFAKIGKGLMETMGGRMRLMVSGGAPLAPKIAYFFKDAGLTVVEGYGLTETMGATCVNLPAQNCIGTVGLPLPGTESMLAPDGELLLRGRGISPGYWNNAEASREVVAGGWLHTGDIAEISPAGIIRIVDRKKDLIVTAGGKNVAPQNIENLLKTNPLISQAVIHGDRRNYLTALITLDEEALRRFVQTQKLAEGSFADMTQRAEVLTEVSKIMAGFNKDLPRYETIKKFKVLQTDFSVETGELTPSLKVKRREINKRYGAIFDGFYDEQF